MRQPIASPTASSGTRPAAVVTMSAAACPRGTAARVIGSVRKRSMTPRCESWAAVNIPVMIPFAAVATSMPGTRKAR